MNRPTEGMDQPRRISKSFIHLRRRTMATISDYTFHVRADKSIAERVFKRILKAGMHDGDEDVKYFEDEQGFGLYFYGYGNDKQASKLRDWLQGVSQRGAEIDWMVISDDGGVWTECSSYIKGEWVPWIGEETYINDWKTAVLVGKAINRDKDAISKIPDAILNLRCDSDHASLMEMIGFAHMFLILSRAGKLEARTQDVEKWEKLLRWRDEENNSIFSIWYDGDELSDELKSAIETRKLLDRAGMNKPNRDIATI